MTRATKDADNDSITYLWDFGDDHKKYSPTSLTSHIYDSPGNYTVTLYASDKWGGIDTISQTVTIISLVDVLRIEDEGITIYPNPAVDGFMLELPEWHVSLNAFLINTSGRKFPVAIRSRKTWIPTNKLESGNYLMVVPGYEHFPPKKIVIINH